MLQFNITTIVWNLIDSLKPKYLVLIMLIPRKHMTMHKKRVQALLLVWRSNGHEPTLKFLFLFYIKFTPSTFKEQMTFVDTFFLRTVQRQNDQISRQNVKNRRKERKMIGGSA